MTGVQTCALPILRIEIAWGIGALIIASTIGIMFSLIIEDRIQKYPHLGDEWIPKSEERRRIEALPKKYIGR